MRNRALGSLVAVLALLCAGLVPGAAQADTGVGTGTGSSTAQTATSTHGDTRCTYYANSSGFGSWCGGAQIGGKPKTWRQRMAGQWPFIPCQNYPIPDGVILPPPPDGKEWILRVWIRDYDLDRVDGGDNVHLEHEIVAVTPEQKEQCRVRDYMVQFWQIFQKQYPTPILVVKPTYIPRVNSPAFFSLGQDTTHDPPTETAYIEVAQSSRRWNGHQGVTMSARVTRLVISPDDETEPFTCTNVTEYKLYDDSKPPTEQIATCKHVFTRSSANKPDGMYTLKISAFWQVRYCLYANGACDWRDLGTWEVKSVQKLPVQEVQGIGGGR